MAFSNRDSVGCDASGGPVSGSRFVQLYLAHTPEVPPERRDAAYAAIARRQANYQTAVADRLSKTGRDQAEGGDA